MDISLAGLVARLFSCQTCYTNQICLKPDLVRLYSPELGSLISRYRPSGIPLPTIQNMTVSSIACNNSVMTRLTSQTQQLQEMTLLLRVLEATDVLFIEGSGIPGGRYLGSSDLSSGAYNCPRSGLRKIWFVYHVCQYDSIATNPSSRYDGLVSRLSP